MVMTLVTTSRKHFVGGNTTAYVLDAGDTYALRVVTRFDSGNYLTERDESNLQPAEALRLAAFYTR